MKTERITSSDLMIGDWVNVVTNDNEPSQIEEIRRYDVDTSDLDEIEYAELNPIPITPEILEKNGFKKKDGDIYLFGGLDPSHSVTIFNSDRDYWWIDVRYGRVRTSIKYVHELQHALKLGKVKKEIEI